LLKEVVWLRASLHCFLPCTRPSSKCGRATWRPCLRSSLFFFPLPQVRSVLPKAPSFSKSALTTFL
jgi:hypothetical protein